MASVFTMIINGDLPGRFVWQDERAVAFLTIEPLKPGHTLVVPREEIDHWVDLEPELASHLMYVSQAIGKAIEHGFDNERVGLIIAGFEVPHTHIHVIPVDTMEDLDFHRADHSADPADLDAAAETIRASLRALGYDEAPSP